MFSPPRMTMSLILPTMRQYPSSSIVAAALETDRTGLGHPIGDGDLAHMHGGGDFLHDLHRTWSPCHDAAPKRAEVEAPEFRVVQLGDEHGGNAVEHIAALRL